MTLREILYETAPAKVKEHNIKRKMRWQRIFLKIFVKQKYVNFGLLIKSTPNWVKRSIHVKFTELLKQGSQTLDPGDNF